MTKESWISVPFVVKDRLRYYKFIELSYVTVIHTNCFRTYHSPTISEASFISTLPLAQSFKILITPYLLLLFLISNAFIIFETKLDLSHVYCEGISEARYMQKKSRSSSIINKGDFIIEISVEMNVSGPGFSPMT